MSNVWELYERRSLRILVDTCLGRRGLDLSWSLGPGLCFEPDYGKLNCKFTQLFSGRTKAAIAASLRVKTFRLRASYGATGKGLNRYIVKTFRLRPALAGLPLTHAPGATCLCQTTPKVFASGRHGKRGGATGEALNREVRFLALGLARGGEIFLGDPKETAQRKLGKAEREGYTSFKLTMHDIQGWLV